VGFYSDFEGTRMKRILLYAALVYLVFVIYGSLVPLEFRPIPLDDALYSFKNIRYLNLGIGSRADWVANILLFIPLAFLWVGVLSVERNLARNIITSCAVFLFCILLCFSIEFTQLFFPPRTVSINDIIAESLGAVIGVAGWWTFGGRVLTFLGKWVAAESAEKKTSLYLYVYLAGIFFYSVMPLDLTLSAVELYHKWNEGRIILIPFTGLRESFIENLYEWGSEILLWVPVSILWKRSTTVNKTSQLLFKVFSAVVAIEFFQLFVFSRVTDATDICLGLIGGGIGVWLTRERSINNDKQADDLNFTPERSLVIGGLAYFIWFFVDMMVFWYPFDFEFSPGLVADRIEGFFNVPFYAYYYGTEFRALTEIFHKVLFFMPLGVILAFMLRPYKYRTFFFWLVLMILMLFAVFIEVGQVFIPGKVVSSTDVLLYVIGGMLGFNIGKALFSVSGNDDAVVGDLLNTRVERNPQAFLKQKDNKLWVEWQSWILCVTLVIVLSIGLFWAGQSSAVPYNIRELVAGDFVFFNSIALSLSFFWCLAFPILYLMRAIKQKMNALLCFIYGVGIHSFFAWVFIRIAAPIESIYDVVGFPVLGVFPEVEIFVRFFVLFSVFSFALFGSTLSVLSIIGLKERLAVYFVSGFVIMCLLLPLDFWIIVIEAATDNLTELMMNEGYSFAVIGFVLYLFLFSFAGALLASSFIFRRVSVFVWAISVVLLSFPLGYMFLTWATEEFIFKYDQVFSALQFLLSPDRAHYLTGEALFIRFCWTNFILLVLVCVAQFSFWLGVRSNIAR